MRRDAIAVTVGAGSALAFLAASALLGADTSSAMSIAGSQAKVGQTAAWASSGAAKTSAAQAESGPAEGQAKSAGNANAGSAKKKDLNSQINVPFCPDTHEFQACVYGINNIQVFTGQGTLGPGALNLYNSHTDWGTADSSESWPQIWSTAPTTMTCDPKNAGDPWCVRFYSHWETSGTEAWAQYANQAPMPGWQLTEIHENNPYSGGPFARCGFQGAPDSGSGQQAAQYVLCSGQMVPTPNHGDHQNYIFDFTNMPVTVQIKNNLADSLTPVSTSVSPTMIQDPVGGTAGTIAAGSVGYYGMYQPASTSGLSPTAPVFSAIYNVPPASGDSYPGGILMLNLVSTGGGISQSKSSCSFQRGQKGTSGSTPTAVGCSIAIQGDPEEAQTVIVNIEQV